jgi:enoyl-CoA hydratase
MEELIQLERPVDKTVILKINRPKQLNALNKEALVQLYSKLQDIQEDESVLSVILTGAGEKAFVAGADIGELKDLNSYEAMEYSLFGHRVFSFIENYDKPVIAAINGYALGGGLELALVCDIRIASDNAKFGMPEINLGIIPGYGGTQRLSKLIGKAKAKEMIFTGNSIDANEAERLGLVNKVVTSDRLMDSAIELCIDLNKKSPVALKQAKQVINNGFGLSVEHGLMLEANAFGVCFSTEYQKESMTAFMERRKPKA